MVDRPWQNMTLDAVMPNAQTLVVGKFLLAYVAVLATPGPNMLAIGGIAALRGFRAAIPFCCGIALGAGILASSLFSAAVVISAHDVWQTMARVVGALLLLSIAGRVSTLKPPRNPTRGRTSSAKLPFHLIEFSAGFCTAAANPITIAYFAAEFVGPLSALNDALPVVITLTAIPTLALAGGLITATILARPMARKTALLWHRPICAAVAMALVVLAASVIRPLVT